MTSPQHDRRSARRRSLVPACSALALLATTLLGACKDTTGLKAQFRTGLDTLTVYALSDTVTARRDYPTAVITGSRSTNADGNVVAKPIVVPVASSAEFDVAFDLDATGKVVLYPQRRVVSGVGGRRVGLQLASGTFESVTLAPTSGYQYDSVAVTVQPGQVVLVQAQTTQCSIELSPYNYSKIVVDSTAPAINAIYFRIASDPNCGFRSFVPGVVPSK